MIPFNKPALLGVEQKYLLQVIANQKFSGSHKFSKSCCNWFEHNYDTEKAFLTPSCTHALEMSALLSNIHPGDEVIMASYGFTSTANAFVLRGAKIVFVDIRPDTMNLDENKIEAAISNRTKVIIVMHYAGVSCEMNTIKQIAAKYNLIIVEDAAQAIGSRYNGQLCGSLGQFGCFSFHETKNLQCGEGGVLLVNDKKRTERAEIIQEKGTNRTQFFRGDIDKYSWVDVGSSFLSSEFNAAFLFAQLENIEKILTDRITSWNFYYESLLPLDRANLIKLPIIPKECEHNAHIFHIKVQDINERTNIIKFLKSLEIGATFHYIPLHSSVAGKRFGVFSGKDEWTTKESERLLRLPLFFSLRKNEIEKVVNSIYSFYKL